MSPIQLTGTSACPSTSSGTWNSASPAIAPAAPEARPTGSGCAPRDRAAGVGAGGEHQPDDEARDDDASCTRGHVPIQSSSDGLARASRPRGPPRTPRARRRTTPGSASGRRANTGTRRREHEAEVDGSGPHDHVQDRLSGARGTGTGRPGRGRWSWCPGTTARCCRPPRQARIISPVAAGTSGRRAKTSAATAAMATENKITLQPEARVEPVAGAAQVTSIDASAPLRPTTYATSPPAGRAADGSRTRPAQASIGRPPTASTRSPTREVGLRRIDGRDQDAGRRPGVLVERDAPSVGRRREAQTHEQQRPGQRRSQQQPRREPASPSLRASPLRGPSGGPTERSRRAQV